MRKSKEERTIEESEHIAKEVFNVCKEGIGVSKYYKLLNEYKKLNKRYKKIIKLSDSMSREIIGQNTKLNQNLEYTIESARKKLIEQNEEHKQTLDLLSKYTTQIHKLENKLQEVYRQNIDLEKKVQYFKINMQNLDQTFYEKFLMGMILF